MRNRKFEIDYELHSQHSTDNKSEEITWKDENDRKNYFINLASEIGWIIIEFSSLENKIESSLILLLVEPSFNKEIIYSEIVKKKFHEKVDLLQNVLRNNYSNNKDIYEKEIPNFEIKLGNIVREIKEAGEIRNKYSHATWSNTLEDKSVQVGQKILNNTIKKVFIRFDIQDIDKDFEKIYSTGNELSEFNEKVWNCYSKMKKL